MFKEMDLETFLNNNNIKRDTWDRANADWDVLREIATDHQNKLSTLQTNAEHLANIIQKFKGVHSVRWRVKDTEHLLEKIVRKLASGEEKYRDINKDSYHQKVTDLIGIRALHLFKNDCLLIDDAIRENWEPIEKPIIYLREGDAAPNEELFTEDKFRQEPHRKGYRSIHYVISTAPTKRAVTSEIQVRTIFEEGWSEIDHNVRYPNFVKNDLLEYFLATFNRISGSADEMGSFVKSLTFGLQNHDIEIEKIAAERDEAIAKVEETLKELEKHQGLNKEHQKTIKKLKSDISMLSWRDGKSIGSFTEKNQTIGSIWSNPHTQKTIHDLLEMTRPKKPKQS